MKKTDKKQYQHHNAILIVSGITAALVLCELFLRIIGFSEPFFYTYDAYTGARHYPNAQGVFNREGYSRVMINSAGMRDYERKLVKPPGIYRIAVLGDSFTEAKQVPLQETFCSLLEYQLNIQHSFMPQRAEVLNFGVSGYGTAQELLALRHHVWRYNPDMIILAIFTGNDIRNNSIDLEPKKSRPFFILNNDMIELDTSFSSSAWFQIRSHVIWPLARHSRLIQLLLFVKERGILKHLHIGKKKTGFDLFDQSEFAKSIYRPPADLKWQKAWQITERIITEMAKEASQNNARFLIVTLSNAIQAHPDPQVREQRCRELHVQNLFYPEERISSLAEQQDY